MCPDSIQMRSMWNEVRMLTFLRSILLNCCTLCILYVLLWRRYLKMHKPCVRLNWWDQRVGFCCVNSSTVIGQVGFKTVTPTFTVTVVEHPWQYYMSSTHFTKWQEQKIICVRFYRVVVGRILFVVFLHRVSGHTIAEFFVLFINWTLKDWI